MRIDRRRLWLLGAVVAAGITVLAVLLIQDRDDAAPVSTGSQVLELLHGRRSLDLRVKVDSPTDGESAFSGRFVVDLDEGTGSGELDMRKVPNDSGVFGDYEEIPTGWDAFTGFFDVTLPDAGWLGVDLRSGSPELGADIASLRPAILCNPNLTIAIVRAAQDPALGTSQVKLDTAEFEDGSSEAISALRDSWGSQSVSLEIAGTADSLSVTTTFTYPVVLSAADDVTVTCTSTLSETDETPELPDPSEVVTYEDLTS